MTKRTEEEIDDKIAYLLGEKYCVPEFTFFGKNHWVEIDAQILILRGVKEPIHFIGNKVYDKVIKAHKWLINDN